MSIKVRRILAGVLLHTLLLAPSFGEQCKKPTLQSVADIWGQFSDLIEQKTLSNPLEQLQPGDVLIFPFHKEGETPETYRKAIEQRHASIVYGVPLPSGKTKLMRLDSPQPPPFARDEFQGEEPYYVLRPKNAGRDYQRRLSRVASAIDHLGFGYDALMQPDYADPKKLPSIKKVCETGEGKLPDMSCAELVATASTVAGYQAPQGITLGEILDKGVAELKETDPKQLPGKIGAAAKEILDMFRMRPRQQIKVFTRLGKEAKSAQGKATQDRDLLLGYLKEPNRPPPVGVVTVLRADIEEMSFAISAKGPQAPPAEIKKELREDMALLEAYLGREVAGPPPEAVQEAMKRSAESLNRRVGHATEDIQFFGKRLKRAEAELKQFAMAEIVLRQLLLSRVTGKPVDKEAIQKDLAEARDEDGKPQFGLLERLGATALLAGEGDLMNRRMIRPVDYLQQSEASGYELVYFYPGNLPALCPVPEGPGPGPGGPEAPGGPENHSP